MENLMQNRHALRIALVIIPLLCACSKNPQPMVEAVKPMQETLESAKGVEQTLQQAAEKQKAAEQ